MSCYLDHEAFKKLFELRLITDILYLFMSFERQETPSSVTSVNLLSVNEKRLILYYNFLLIKEFSWIFPHPKIFLKKPLRQILDLPIFIVINPFTAILLPMYEYSKFNKSESVACIIITGNDYTIEVSPIRIMLFWLSALKMKLLQTTPFPLSVWCLLTNIEWLMDEMDKLIGMQKNWSLNLNLTFTLKVIFRLVEQDYSWSINMDTMNKSTASYVT